jgi:hypothetical protein
MFTIQIVFHKKHAVPLYTRKKRLVTELIALKSLRLRLCRCFVGQYTFRQRLFRESQIINTISATNCHMMSSTQNKVFSVNSKLIRLYECSTIPRAFTRKQFLGTIHICKKREGGPSYTVQFFRG